MEQVWRIILDHCFFSSNLNLCLVNRASRKTIKDRWYQISKRLRMLFQDQDYPVRACIKDFCGSPKSFRWALRMGLWTKRKPITMRDRMATISKYASFKVLKIAHKKGWPVVQGVLRRSIREGNKEGIHWALNRGADKKDDSVCFCLPQDGRFDMVKYLAREGFSISNRLFAILAENGEFETIKWLAKKGHHIPSCTIGPAAVYGDMEMLDWLMTRVGTLTPDEKYDVTHSIGVSCDENEELDNWVRKTFGYRILFEGHKFRGHRAPSRRKLLHSHWDDTQGILIEPRSEPWPFI